LLVRIVLALVVEQKTKNALTEFRIVADSPGPNISILNKFSNHLV